MFGTHSHRELPEDDDEINITAMIDIVMLLLIFFMITSKLQQTSPLQVPSAQHGKDISVDQSIMLSIFRSETDPEIYLSDGTQKNGPVDQDAVRAHIKAGIDLGRKNVIIKADRDVPSGFVEEVARTIAEVDPELKFYLGVVDKPQ